MFRRGGFAFSLTLAAMMGLLVCGCATVPRDAGFSDVQRTIDARLGRRIEWRRAPEDDARADAAVSGLLGVALTADTAVSVAFLRNAHLQATLEDLGVAQADLVQAGLLKNPVFNAIVRLPDRSPSGTDVELSVIEDFLSILWLPARKRLAAAEFEAAKTLVTDQVLKLSADVRIAVYQVQGAAQIAEMEATIRDAAKAGVDLAARQREAGNINELDLAIAQLNYENAKLDLAKAEAQGFEYREKLGRLMGLTRRDWRVADALPELPATEERLQDLTQRAAGSRLDIVQAAQEVEVATQRLGLARKTLLGDAAIGADVEHNPDGQNVAGPTFSVALPIFDQGQAAIARAQAQLRQSRERLLATQVDAESEVAETLGRMMAARATIEAYRSAILPLRRRVLQQLQLQNNAMAASVFQLLEARREEVAARRESIEAQRNYWIARAELERAVGWCAPTIQSRRPTTTTAPGNTK